ncbi:hypothetical protein GCK72_020801 [Caenorhabditis remanei]|uniref:F-box domain-containing protein n=1 Tax=Caenorhabditis remanei TaxID=31234 RepID=A0A6A5GI18_CAERE|nr:hypothetical protein GCK72_020801 [Caenorhabditis remanei]KAF1754241.1 hypothetical protein GCK72_020801 [Caenorhabditis remanei]
MSNSLDLPDLVIRGVLEKLDMNSILTLRKVNHRLRSFIDTEKPDYRIHNIIVTVREDCIELLVDKKEPLSIEYHGKGQNTLVVCNGKELTINANSVKTCIKDLKIMVKNQKSMFEGLTISCPYGERFDQEMMNEFLGGFKNILTSREQKFRSRTLKMFVENQNQVMEVLPYLCPNTLQEVHLIDPQLSSIQFEIDEIIKLTHWKKLTYFAISGFYVNESIRKFSHLLEAYIEIQSATAEDVLYLKEVKVDHAAEL